MWTAIFGIVAAILSDIPIGGMYLHHIITEPFLYVGLPAAAIRLAKPVSWWAKWFYWGSMGSDGQLLQPYPKLVRALARFPEQTVDFEKPPSPVPQPIPAESTVAPPSISRLSAVTEVEQEQTPNAFPLHEPPPIPVPATPQRPPLPQPPPPAAPIVQKNYWVARNGVEIGEFTPVDFRESVDSGKIRQDDSFWMEGMSEWKSVSELKILEKLHPPPRPTPRPTNTAQWSRTALTAGLIAGAITLAVLGVLSILVLVGMVQSDREQRLRPRAERQRIVSDDGKIEVTAPNSWTKMPDLVKKGATVMFKHEVALYVGDDSRETYLIVVTHPKTEVPNRLGSTITLEEHHQLTRDQRLEEMKNASATSPILLLIDGHPALQDEITGTRKGIDWAFLHTTINEGDYFQEILGSTVKSRWQEQNELLHEIASSFRTEK